MQKEIVIVGLNHRSAPIEVRESVAFENALLGDALAKLERLGLVTRDGETYAAVPVGDGLAKLDAAWDNVFNFSARR